MSHFFTLVLVPDDTGDVRSEVEDLLAPYDEELAVPEYQTMCFCVRDRSYRQAKEEAAARFGTLEQLQTRFNAEYCRPDGLNEYDSHWRKQQAWTEFAKDFFEFCEDRERELLRSTEPDPECEDCKGTGFVASTCNPDSRWDWWQIGGRWNGALALETCSSCGGTGQRGNAQDGVVGTCDRCDGTGFSSKLSIQSALYDGNSMPVPDIRLTTYPLAVVTPHGAWHQRAQMGSFGVTSCDVDRTQWTELVDALLEEHSHCVAVVVDCHI